MDHLIKIVQLVGKPDQTFLNKITSETVSQFLFVNCKWSGAGVRKKNYWAASDDYIVQNSDS